MRFKTLDADVVGERELLVRRSFKAPSQLVFDCWTKPALLRKWLTGPDGWSLDVCEIDLQPGGDYTYEWAGLNAARLVLKGRFIDIVPAKRIDSVETFVDDDWTGGKVEASVVFEPEPGGTLTTQRLRYGSMEARSGAMATGMTDGMETSYTNLDAVLTELAG